MVSFQWTILEEKIWVGSRRLGDKDHVLELSPVVRTDLQGRWSIYWKLESQPTRSSEEAEVRGQWYAIVRVYRWTSQEVYGPDLETRVRSIRVLLRPLRVISVLKCLLLPFRVAFPCVYPGPDMNSSPERLWFGCIDLIRNDGTFTDGRGSYSVF